MNLETGLPKRYDPVYAPALSIWLAEGLWNLQHV